jgi:hypothetical protein
MTGDQPARLAAIDQQLAAIDTRLNRSIRSIRPVARPPLRRWEVVVTLAAVAAVAVSGYFQGLMLRSLRAEIRELRTRP